MKKIILLIAFVFILTSCAGPQLFKVSICDEKDKTEDCKTFKVQGEGSVLPF